jgi:hypothetical protein
VVEGLIIERRFCGPPDSANGGYACGMVASLLGGPAEVTLRSPPPLDRPLEVERAGGGVRVLNSGKLIAEAKPVTLGIDAPPPPTWAQAVEAEARYPWFETHPFPGCFVCGSARAVEIGRAHV